MRTVPRLLIVGVSFVSWCLSPAADQGMQVRYEGTLVMEGDFRRPGETRSYHAELSYGRWADGRVRTDWTTWPEGDTTGEPESFLLCGDSVFHRDAPDAKWVLLVGRRAHEGHLRALAAFPGELARLANEHKVDSRIELTGKRPKLRRYEERFAHPRLGDARDSILYTWRKSEVTPVSFKMDLHERDIQWHLEARRVAESDEGPAESPACPPSAFDRQGGAPDRLVDEPSIVPLAPGLWLANMEDVGSRTLIVEFAEYLTLVEFAVGSSNGERVVDAARKKWPGKPVRYALFGHYHPHYVGGVRAMIAEGATVVTTPLNAVLVKKLAALPFTIEPDRLARSPRRPKIKTFTDRFELADSTNELVAINYGTRSQHTDEFVVFYLPRAKILFESSIGWRGPEGRIRLSGGVAPLLEWADEQKLDVDRMVQSWPMRGTAAEATRAELDSLVQAGKTGK